MVILGLTGCIGMGKTTVANHFRALGVPVYDADAEVHKLMAKGGPAVSAIEAAFSSTVRDGAVDRAALAGRVFDNTVALRRLETILHPLVWRGERRFLSAAARRRTAIVVLDVPLLLETGGDGLCDGVVVVTAPPFVQKHRVMARPGMTAERFLAISARQMPDVDKRRRADFIITTGLGASRGLRQVADIVRVASGWRGHCWRTLRVTFDRAGKFHNNA